MDFALSSVIAILVPSLGTIGEGHLYLIFLDLIENSSLAINNKQNIEAQIKHT